MRVGFTIVALAILFYCRIPNISVPIVNVDEADFVVEARELVEGGRPYVAFVEKKPPLIYAMFAAAMRAVGNYNLPALRWLLVFYVLATAVVVGEIARRLYDPVVGAWTIPLYAALVSVGPALDFQAVNAESLFLLPLVGATCVFLLPRSWATLLTAGVLVSVASLIKQQAGMQLAVLCAASIVDQRSAIHRLRDIALIVLGFLIPWCVALAWMGAIGVLYEFYFWTIEINRYYVAHGNALSRRGMYLLWGNLRTMWDAQPGTWLFAGLAFAYETLARERRRKLLVLWIALSLVPISLGGRFFAHYFLQLFPALAILAAASLTAMYRWANSRVARSRALGPRGAAIACGALVIAIAVGSIGRPAVRWTEGEADAEAVSIPWAMPSARRLSDWVRRVTAPDDRIVVWGYGSGIYYLSQRRPAVRFPYVTYLVGAVEATSSWWSPFVDSKKLEVPRAWELFFADFDAHPPVLFVDTAGADYFGFSKFHPEKYPRLIERLRASYDRDVFAGFPIWRRRTAQSSAR